MKTSYVLFLLCALFICCDKEDEKLSPVINSFQPEGGRPTTEVTVTGKNFGQNPTVYIGDVQAAIVGTTSPERIVFEVPANASNGLIKVISDGVSGVSLRSFSVYQSPVIESFSPASGVTGDIVTVFGKNFTPNSAISFGGAVGYTYEITNSSIKAFVPEDGIPAKLEVITMGGTVTSATDFIANQPVITSVTSKFTSLPFSVSGPGHRFIITGKFNKTGSNNIVKINGVEARQIHKIVTNELLVEVPSNATSGKLTVTLGSYTTTFDQEITIPKGEWERINDFPGEARGSAQVFVIGENAYVGTGLAPGKGTYLNDFWKFDATTESWTRIADLPAGGRFSATAFSINGKGYVGGGAVLKDFWEYSPSTNSWERKADMPANMLGNSYTLNGKGYALSTYNCELWEYDPQLDAWTKKTSYPGSCVEEPTFFVIDEKLYVGAGNEDHQFFEYDPLNDAWTIKASYPGGALMGAMAFSVDDFGYCGAGRTWGSGFFDGFQEDMWRYDPQLNEWNPSVPFLGVTLSTPENMNFKIGNKAYVILESGTLSVHKFTP